MSDVAAPDYTEWWDPDEVQAAVLDKLRLTDVDIDAPRIEALIPAAGRDLNAYLDRVTAVDADEIVALQPKLVDLVIANYLPPERTLDGKFVDPVATVAASVRGTKERWGIA